MPFANAPDGCALYFEALGDLSAPALLVGYPWNDGWVDLQYALMASTDEIEGLKAVNRQFIAALAEHFMVIQMEYPRGCGETGGPMDGDLLPATIAADYVAIADAAGVDRFVTLGYSWSGGMGLQVASRTERCAGLICGGWPPLGAPYEEILGQVRATVGAAPEGRTRDIMQTNMRFYEDIVAHYDEAAGLAAMRSRAGLLQCIVAAGDQGVPEMGLVLPIAEQIRENKTQLEEYGWQVDVVPDTDHMTLPPQQRFTDLILDFLKGKTW